MKVFKTILIFKVSHQKSNLKYFPLPPYAAPTDTAFGKIATTRARRETRDRDRYTFHY